MQETWVWSLGWEDPLEKGMATYSSILAWRIPWTEEPGGLQSLGLQNQTQLSNFHFHHRWQLMWFFSVAIFGLDLSKFLQTGVYKAVLFREPAGALIGSVTLQECCRRPSFRPSIAVLFTPFLHNYFRISTPWHKSCGSPLIYAPSFGHQPHLPCYVLFRHTFFPWKLLWHSDAIIWVGSASESPAYPPLRALRQEAMVSQP